MARAEQARVRRLVELRGTVGVTWKEVADTLATHHGAASGALSNLHEKGWVVRLTEKRDRCAVYVTPEYVDGRPVAPRRSQRDRYSEGRDAGWLEGYEAGVASVPPAPPQQNLKEVYREGYAAGKTSGATDAKVALATIVDEMIRVTAGGPVVPHTGDCWRLHPVCALRAVRKAIR
jgi:hypothetical protein